MAKITKDMLMGEILRVDENMAAVKNTPLPVKPIWMNMKS